MDTSGTDLITRKCPLLSVAYIWIMQFLLQLCYIDSAGGCDLLMNLSVRLKADPMLLVYRPKTSEYKELSLFAIKLL
jgi:hypothetical protein